jgi:hypothetical protein
VELKYITKHKLSLFTSINNTIYKLDSTLPVGTEIIITDICQKKFKDKIKMVIKINSKFGQYWTIVNPEFHLNL